MASLLCKWCERRWPPLEDDYGACPLCREHTQLSFTAPDYDLTESARQRVEFAFGWWLWDTGRL